MNTRPVGPVEPEKPKKFLVTLGEWAASCGTIQRPACVGQVPRSGVVGAVAAVEAVRGEARPSRVGDETGGTSPGPARSFAVRHGTVTFRSWPNHLQPDHEPIWPTERSSSVAECVDRRHEQDHDPAPSPGRVGSSTAPHHCEECNDPSNPLQTRPRCPRGRIVAGALMLALLTGHDLGDRGGSGQRFHDEHLRFGHPDQPERHRHQRGRARHQVQGDAGRLDHRRPVLQEQGEHRPPHRHRLAEHR